jgi:hypothetical protein
VPQALSLFFLDYLYNASLNPHRRFVFRGAVKGSLAASLSNARYTNSSFIHDLFVNRPVGGGKDPCLKEVIQGRADKDDPGAFARCR